MTSPNRSLSELLHQHPFTRGLEESIIDLIAGCAKNVVFQAGEYLLREGEHATHFYLVRHGTVALEMYFPGRGPQTFLTVKSGEMLGSNWLVPPYRWSYDARAVEVTRAIAFECHCLLEKCESDHHVGYELMKRFIPPLVERMQAARLQSANLYGQADG